MMKLNKLIIMLFALSLLIFIGCEDEKAINEFEVMTDYMVENDLDLDDITASWITSAEAVFNAGPENYFILDIREAAAFTTGHVPGAHNVALADVVEYCDANYDGTNPILVICYTGQSASFANVALKLSGYPNVLNLKYGMSGWNSDFDSWTANVGNASLDYTAGWDDSIPPALPTFGFPELSTGEETGADILAARVEAMLSAGFKGILATEVLQHYDTYNVMNYWAVADWTTYGHVSGASLIVPGSLGIEAGLGAVDPEGINVPYCWTGQTSAVVAAWLNVLGYDATSYKFGVNSTIYDELAAGPVKWAGSADYAYESGS